jgi:hypothetical protein
MEFVPFTKCVLRGPFPREKSIRHQVFFNSTFNGVIREFDFHPVQVYIGILGGHYVP